MKVRLSNPVLFVAPLLLGAVGCEDSVSGPSLDDDILLEPGYALVSTAADVTLHAEADTFQPGAPVTLVLENHSGDQIGFNLCFHAIEQLVDDTWVMEPDSRVCTTHLNLLDSGNTAHYPTELPGDLTPGEYRFRVALYLTGDQEHRDQVSAAFEIGG